MPLVHSFWGTETLIYTWYLGVTITVIILNGNIHKYLSNIHYVQWIFIISVLIIYRVYVNVKASIDFYNDYLISALIASLILILICFLNSRKKTIFNNKISKITQFMANYSYTLYLIHFSVCSIYFMIGEGRYGLLRNVEALMIANIVSLFIAYFTEMRYREIGLFIKRKIGLIRD